MRDNEKRSVDQSRDHDKYPVDVAGRQVTENENQHRKRGGTPKSNSLALKGASQHIHKESAVEELFD